MYMTNEYTMADLAEHFGCSKRTIWKAIRNSDNFEVAEHNATIRTRIAQTKLKNASADAVEKLLKLLEKDRDKDHEYVDIQLIQQVLDRAGVRAAKEEKQDINIKFNTGGIVLGVPDHSKDGKV